MRLAHRWNLQPEEAINLQVARRIKLESEMIEQVGWLLLSLLGSITTSVGGAHTFTSLVHLVESIEAVKDVAPYMERYIKAERERLESIERLMEDITEHHNNISQGNAERHLSNPVNAYIVTKSTYKLMNDSMTLLDNTAKENLADYLKSSSKTRAKLPSKDDFDGAILALLRLQDTYELTTSQLSDSDLGLLNHGDEAPPLNGDDCYNIGRTVHFMNDFYHAVMWFQKALEKYEKLAGAGHNMAAKISSTLDFLSFALYKQDNIELAIAMTQRWVQLVPGAKPGTANLVQYYRILTERNTTYNASNLPSLKNTQRKPTEEYITYEKLCQGKETHELRTKNLGCHNEPILFSYCPAKVEVLNDVPRLVYYHHIMSDKEVEKVKDLARPKCLVMGS